VYTAEVCVDVWVVVYGWYVADDGDEECGCVDECSSQDEFVGWPVLVSGSELCCEL